MRILITLSALTTLILFSCQKEGDFANRNSSGGGGGGNNSSGLLVKMVVKGGTDSSVYNYSYNSSGKLIGILVTGSDGGSPIYNNKAIIRNSQGIIQKIIMKDADFIQAGVDSVEFNVRYDPSASRYTGWTAAIDDGFDILRDSVVYTYSAGKLVTETGYEDGGTGTYHPSGKADYTHSGNNIVTKKVYTYNQGTYNIDFTITDEFDTKTAALSIGVEGFIIEANSLAPYYSVNNITKETVTYPSDPTETLMISYTYNSSNKPSSAIYAIQPGNQTFNVSYFYQ